MTNSSQFFSTSEARKVLSDLINQVKYQGKSFSIGRHGEAEAILCPINTEEMTQNSEARPYFERIQAVRSEKNKTEDLASAVYKRKFKQLAQQYDLRLIVLFGSQAQNKAKWHSDVDIAFLPSADFDYDQESTLYSDLSQMLGREDVDLVNLATTQDVLLRYEVFMHGKVLYEKPKTNLLSLCLRAWFDYQDFKPYYKLMDKVIDKKLNKLTQLK